MVVTEDGVQLNVTLAGRADAPLTVVFAHGWSLSSAAWSAEAEALGREVRVVTYDQRGHGGSGWPEAVGPPPSIDRLGEDLNELLQKAVPEGPVVLVGHSMGGMTIMALAAAHPELFGTRVVGVALVCTSAGRLVEVRLGLSTVVAWLLRPVVRLVMAFARRWPRLVEWFMRRRATHSPRSLRRMRRFLFGPTAPDDAVRSCAEIVAATPMRIVAAFYRALLEHDKHETLHALRTVPTTIMVGELDLLTPPEHSRALAEAIPDAKLVVVPGCGHMLPMEQPDIVVEQLELLLERVRAREAGT